MKKLLMLLLCCFSFCLLTACTGDSIVGEYEFSSMKMTIAGQEIEVKAGEEFQGITFSADAATLSVKKDGTFTMTTQMGATASVEGTWEKTDKGYTFTADGVPVTITKDGSKLILSTGESETVFKKK